MGSYPSGAGPGRPVPVVHFRGACPCGKTHPNRAPFLKPYRRPR